MTSEITKAEPAQVVTTGFDMLPVAQIVQQTAAIQELMNQSMQDGTHFGKIPGCGDKPALLQPGAQKLMLLFGLADDYDVNQIDLPNGHREYRVKCRLVSKATGVFQGSGEGLCTTMESKYRYRRGAGDYEITDLPIPDDAKQRKAEYAKQGYGMRKVDGHGWCWVKFKEGKSENPDIADTYNTVLKMACKRALVAGILNTLAASDMFTQDVEDFNAANAPQQPTAPQNRPQNTNTANNAHRSDNPYLGPLRAAMQDAKAAGYNPRSLTVEIEDFIGCEVEAMGEAMVAEAVAYVRAKIDDTGSDVLLDEDIEF